MIANAIDDAMQGGPPGVNGTGPELPEGYRADRASPHIWKPQQEAGRYDALFATVRSMVDPELRTLSDHVKSGHYSSDILRSLAYRYYHLAQKQIRSKAGALNWSRLELLKERAWLETLLAGILKKPYDAGEVALLGDAELQELRDTVISYTLPMLNQDRDRPVTAVIPLTVGDAMDRVDETGILLQGLVHRIRRAQRLGIYFDNGPLLVYWQTPYRERGDLSPTIMPTFMARLHEVIDITSSSIWREQAQHINAHTSAKEGARGEDSDEDEQRPARRSLFGKVFRR